MLQIRRSEDRGHFDHGWLDTYHTFSFSDYYNPEHMGFRSLRVINEDRVAGGQGFGMHPHRDMEIITYILSGALSHRDSLGNGSTIRPGDVQRMTAGTGIRHSEFNGSETEPVHLLQIWILPEKPGLTPSYEEKKFPEETRRDQLRLVASRGGRDGAVNINQDTELYVGTLSKGSEVTHPLRAGRHAWVQVARGGVTLNGQSLRAGDGAAVSEEAALAIRATEPSEVLVFDLN
jgi:quercetin 2,3-dioxygenase